MEKREDGWWFHDPNNSDPYFQEVGPYQTKKEAEDGQRGLRDFWKALQNMSVKTSKRRKKDVPKVSAPSKSLQADKGTGSGNNHREALSPVRGGVRQALLF